MSASKPAARFYATFAVAVAVTVVLGALLARPASRLEPDRKARTFELDEPPRSTDR